MWLVIRNRQNHRYAAATEEERRSLYQPGDIIDLGDWPGGPGKKVEESDTMIAVEIRDRTTNQFKQNMRAMLVERFGAGAEAKFDEFFYGEGKEKRGWQLDLPTVRAGLTAGQRQWLREHKNNISLTAVQFVDAFKAAIRRRPGSSGV